ncbi:hypothetical protein OHA02_52425 [Streptomyces phaeochromogenes]|nr:hypothetical protein [Streptomyces phaeochromogenes]
MDAGEWIALGAGAVATVAAIISLSQAKSSRVAADHAKRQAVAADAQVDLARQQLAQAEQAQREQNEPYVIVDIQPDGPGSDVLVLVVENIGPTLARNVHITASPPLVSGWGDPQTQSLQRSLGRTIPMLPPGRRLKFLFDNHHRFSSSLPLAYDFTVKAEGPYGPMEDLEYTVDFGTWEESLMGERPTKKLEEKVGEVGASLKKLADHYGKANAAAMRSETERVIAQVMRQTQQDDSSDGIGS